MATLRADLACQLRIPGEEHLAHAAAPEFANDLIHADAFANARGGCRANGVRLRRPWDIDARMAEKLRALGQLVRA